MSLSPIPPEGAAYVQGELFELSPADDRVPYSDNPPAVVLVPAGPAEAALETAPADDRVERFPPPPPGPAAAES